MKKNTISGIISLAIMVVLTCALIMGSDGIYNALSSFNKTEETASGSSTGTGSSSGSSSAVAVAKVKTGLGIVIDRTSSKSATSSADGLGQTDATIAAVTVDDAGKVVACKIDVAQIKINFNNAGQVTTDPAGSFPTKQEKGFDYGMVAYAGAKYEWFEQADAFAAYCVGKTAAQIDGIAFADGYIDDSVDLKASVTIHATDFKDAVVKAIKNATVEGATANDALGLAVVTNINNSKDASADAEGLTQAYSTITAVTVDSKGKITSAVIDAYQSNVNFDATGTVTTDLTSLAQTKNELKDGYNMRGASGIGKEWYEQAAYFANYIVGKDAAGIDGIAVDKGYATDTDLLAGVTIHVTDFKAVVAKAVQDAGLGSVAKVATKTGLGIVIDRTSSKSATSSADGLGQTDATIAAVTVDDSGKVVACKIDVAQIKINFNNAGQITTDPAGSFPTKQEKGFDYGMVAYAGAKYEWFEQADAFAAYCVGKTASQIEGIAFADGYIDDSVDLKASVTIHATDFKDAVVKAINNATVEGSSVGDALGLSVVTNINNSKDASADAEGLTQAYSTITAITVDSKGKITSAVIDAYQSNVNFDATGTVTTDLTSAALTKNELKDGYNMRGASGIGKEWFEQAAYFADFIVGKDAAGIEGIAVDKGYATDTDLLAGVTIHVTDFKAVVSKALKDAGLGVEVVASAGIKTGLGIVIDRTNSKSATSSADGLGQTDATIAAVTVDDSGRVVACTIDVAQIKINFSNTGAITTDAAGPFPTKREKGFDYGMKAYANAPYEWFEQADSFAEYCIGKTAAEIKGIAVTNGYIDDSVDLKATVTIHATDFIEAVAKAIENATVEGGSDTDKLGLAVVTNINSSKDATASADGLTQAYSTITAVTVDDNGTITSAVIDAYQSNVNFDATGNVTTDLTSAAITKNELMDGYNMRGASGIGKEWFEQAAYFADYCVGKNAAGIDGIAIDAGYAGDADLKAGVTIHVTDFKSVMSKAIANAK